MSIRTRREAVHPQDRVGSQLTRLDDQSVARPLLEVLVRFGHPGIAGLLTNPPHNLERLARDRISPADDDLRFASSRFGTARRHDGVQRRGPREPCQQWNR